MTEKKSGNGDRAGQTNNNLNGSTRLQQLLRKGWFVPLTLFLLTLIYFLPSLSFQTAIIGTDDGIREWSKKGNMGHTVEKFSDTWSPLNGGTAVMERRFGRFINPTFLFHQVMKKYQARTFEYMFWMFVGALLMFFYLREIGMSRMISLLLAISFVIAPGFQSYIFAGHFARMSVVAMLPGMLFFTERMLKRFNLLVIIGLPPLLALAIYSEHLQLAFFAFLGIGIYYAAKMIYLALITKKITIKEGAIRSAGFALALTIGALTTSMSTFPSMHHTNVTSQRAGGVDYEYSASFSMHPEEVFTLLEPDFIGWGDEYWGQNSLKLNSEYFGLIFIALAILLFVLKKRSFDLWLYVLFIVGALLFSLGAHTPFHRLTYNLIPGIKSFRAPGMMYIWFFIPTLVLAGYCLEEITRVQWHTLPDTLKKRIILFGGIVLGFTFLYMLATAPFAKFWLNNFYNKDILATAQIAQKKSQTLDSYLKNMQLGGFLVFLSIAAFCTLTWFKMKGKLSTQSYLLILMVIVSVDLIRIARPFYSRARHPYTQFSKREAWEESIAKYINSYDKGYFRVHSVMGDFKQYILGLDLAYVFDDFANKNYNEIVQMVKNFDRYLEHPQYRKDPAFQKMLKNLYNFLSIKYLVTLQNVSDLGFTPIYEKGNLFIYKNADAFPYFYLAQPFHVDSVKKELLSRIQTGTISQGEALVATLPAELQNTSTVVDSNIQNKVTITSIDLRNGKAAFSVTSDSKQLFIFGQNYNPGWKATVNGEKSPVIRANYLWNATVVPEGESTVEFTYNSAIAEKWRKVTLYSTFFYLVFSVVYIGWYLLERKKKKQP